MDNNNEISQVQTPREIIFYKDGDNQVKVEVLLQNENLWLSQAKMAELFGVQKAAVSRHLKNIFDDGDYGKLFTQIQKMAVATGSLSGEIEGIPLKQVFDQAYASISALRKEGESMEDVMSRIGHTEIKWDLVEQVKQISDAGSQLERLQDEQDEVI